MSVLSAVKDYLLTYSGLEAGVQLGVDFLGSNSTGYSIVSLPGTKVVEKYIDGGSMRAFTFMFLASFSTADEQVRLENLDFYEDLSDWFDTQTEAGTLPTLATGKTATAIEAMGWGFVYEQGQSETGIYQLICKLTYEQIAP
jgi:hypothetical protein